MSHDTQMTYTGWGNNQKGQDRYSLVPNLLKSLRKRLYWRPVKDQIVKSQPMQTNRL